MNSGGLAPRDEEQVRALLARGSTKSAVELAKEIHKRHQTPESEALLVGAYAERIGSLMEHGMITEATALLKLAQDRYASARETLTDVALVVAARQTSLDGLVGLLNDPAISEARRRAIEVVIKREVVDLSALAQCPALAPEHPLRRGAADLEKAFEKVTSGPVADGDLSLPEVSRRGPLAPWKMLVRAIAHFYRKEDGDCERWLDAIDPASAAARPIPAMRAMLSGKSGMTLRPASAELAHRVGGGMKELRRALESLDSTFRKKYRSKIIPEIQMVVSACRSACPEMLDRLRQHILVRAASSGLPAERIPAALGVPAKNAYFWRLFARSVEAGPEPSPMLACHLWEEFRRHAVAEGWFAEKGPEAAALCLHMAELLDRIPGEHLAEMRQHFMAHFSDFNDFYKGQSPAIRAVATRFKEPDFYFLFPAQLFERACAMDPHAEAFELWTDWARRGSQTSEAEHAADAWRRALPRDNRPLLYLMEAAEKRGALKKAFGFLEEAEKLDAVNPEVRRAALRLLVGQSIRHLRQRKAHLAEQDLTALETLPQVQEGDRPAFLAALSWACCVIRCNPEAASTSFMKASELLQSAEAATLACRGVAEACGFGGNERAGCLPPDSPQERKATMGAAVARACALGDDMGVPFGIPAAWESSVLRELQKSQIALDTRALRALAEAALRRDRREMAYAATAAGLAKGGDTEARFMLLRARALPEWEFERRAECIAAAAELARRRRDMDLVGEAVELRRGRRSRRARVFDWIDALDQEALSITMEELNLVLDREKRLQRFTDRSRPAFRSRFAGGAPFGRGWKEEGEIEEEEHEIEAFGEMIDELEQVLGGEKREGRPKKRKGKALAEDFTNQGDLPF